MQVTPDFRQVERRLIKKQKVTFAAFDLKAFQTSSRANRPFRTQSFQRASLANFSIYSSSLFTFGRETEILNRILELELD